MLPALALKVAAFAVITSDPDAATMPLPEVTPLLATTTLPLPALRLASVIFPDGVPAPGPVPMVIVIVALFVAVLIVVPAVMVNVAAPTLRLAAVAAASFTVAVNPPSKL